MSKELDVLFVGLRRLWPLDRGFRVHGMQMARALHRLGLRVGVTSACALPPDGPDWLRGLWVAWPRGGGTGGGGEPWLTRRLAGYFGMAMDQLHGLERVPARAVIGLGVDGLLPLSLLGPDRTRVWYAADEMLLQHASCLGRESLSRWPARLRRAAVEGLMERSLGGGLDAAIAVSRADQRALRMVMGLREVWTIPNGVDTQAYQPAMTPCNADRSAIFWGNLAFEPNDDAAVWFLRHVWPRLRDEHGGERLEIVGGGASDRLRRWAHQPCVRLTGYVPDVCDAVRGASVAVLPLRCGFGVKNKLLEAAAMGCAIVASERTLAGLTIPRGSAVVCCRGADAWVRAITGLWSDASRRAAMGAAARAWVSREHTWERAAVELARRLGLYPQEARMAA